MKAVVVYFSYTGLTDLVARAIAKVTGGELRRVEEVKPRKGILGFIRGGKEAVFNQHVAIKPIKKDWGDSDLIFIGCPLWAAKAAPALSTFLEDTDFGGRRVVGFCTYGGSSTEGLKKSLEETINAKHGEFVDFFSIRTGGVKNEEVIRQAEEQAKKYLA